MWFNVKLVCGVTLIVYRGVCRLQIFRADQNRKYTPCMTLYFVISLPKIPYIHRTYMVLTNPTNTLKALD